MSRSCYGTEAYYVNDVDERVAVHGSLDQDLDEEIVCFDLETTGLDKETERHHRDRRGASWNTGK